mgnify:CR=1 FL=1
MLKFLRYFLPAGLVKEPPSEIFDILPSLENDIYTLFKGLECKEISELKAVIYYEEEQEVRQEKISGNMDKYNFLKYIKETIDPLQRPKRIALYFC